MLRKNMLNRVYKYRLFLASILTATVLAGCSAESGETFSDSTSDTEKSQPIGNEQADQAEEIRDDAIDAAEEAFGELYSPNDEEAVGRIVEYLGEKGYVAVDYDNRFNMANSDRLLSFIDKTGSNQEDEIVVLRPAKDGGLTEYILTAKANAVSVIKNQYAYDGTTLNIQMASEYVPDVFEYTPEGYLVMEGHWDSEQMYVLALSEEEDHAALRVSPMEDELRKLTKKYLLSVSYGSNNIFITSWPEDNYDAIDWYDVFALFYEEVCGRQNPYVIYADLSIGNEYQIPAKEFEEVVTAHFPISEEQLRSMLRYDADSECYLYRPRGYTESDYCEIPYPEVRSYSIEDGIISLEVNAVFANDNTSRLFSHVVRLRDDDGKITYLSNTVDTKDRDDLWWHTPRMTDEEWDENYENVNVIGVGESVGDDSLGWMITGPECNLFSREEIKNIEEEVLNAAQKISDFSSGSRKKTVETLAKEGLTVTSFDMNMENKEGLLRFYDNVKADQSDLVTVYDVKEDGNLTALSFLYRDGALQTYYVAVDKGENSGSKLTGQEENNKPKLTGQYTEDLDSVILTEKGYFFYKYKKVIEHESLCYYYRVEPLSDRCREYSKKYLKYLDPVKYNFLTTDWDENTVSSILEPGLFQDLYFIKYHEWFDKDSGSVDEEIFEDVMTTYLPTDVSTLRKCYEYNASSKTYCADDAPAQPYMPFMEVTDYDENSDGTITLYADAVWPDYMRDRVFTDKIVIKPNGEDFMFLSNKYEKFE